MTYSFKNKIALVTGGASGYGEAAVRRFVSKGFVFIHFLRIVGTTDKLEYSTKVVIVDLNEKLGAALVAELNKNNSSSSPTAVFGKADVTSEEDMRAVFDLAVKTFGRVDIVLNNAGVAELSRFDEDPKGMWRKVIDIDLTAVILGTVLATEYMHKTGGGVVINTASAAGLMPLPVAPIYTAAKHGVIGFTTALRPLLRTKKVRVNAIAPFFSPTPLVTGNRDANSAFDRIVGSTPLTPVSSVVDGIFTAIENEDLVARVVMISPKGVKVLPPVSAKL
ncbi:hypothetical protein BC828DRAFT_357990 [Blastocladiella britannica]|nr:hypothetical protein BC828DRAFT_357990 [Blastocladiella britannica]